MVTYLSPVVAVVVGAAVLGEHIGWNLFVGAVIVVAGVALAEGRLPVLRVTASSGLPPAAPPVPAPESPPG